MGECTTCNQFSVLHLTILPHLRELSWDCFYSATFPIAPSHSLSYTRPQLLIRCMSADSSELNFNKLVRAKPLDNHFSDSSDYHTRRTTCTPPPCSRVRLSSQLSAPESLQIKSDATEECNFSPPSSPKSVTPSPHKIQNLDTAGPEGVSQNNIKVLSVEQRTKLLAAIKDKATVWSCLDPIDPSILSHKDMERLCSPESMLNDEPINAYLQLVAASENRRQGKQTVVTMNSFFYALQSGKSDKMGISIAKWLQKRVGDPGVVEQLLVPLHLKYHWALAVLHPKLQQMKVYDSLPTTAGKRDLEVVRHSSPLLCCAQHYFSD
jgi:hypothetical protein